MKTGASKGMIGLLMVFENRLRAGGENIVFAVALRSVDNADIFVLAIKYIGATYHLTARLSAIMASVLSEMHPRVELSGEDIEHLNQIKNAFDPRG